MMMILCFLIPLIDLMRLIHLHHLQTRHCLPVLLYLPAVPALPHRVWSMWTILSLLLRPQGLHPTLAAQNRLTALPSASRLLSLRQNRLLTLLRFPNSLLVSNDQNCLLGWICTLLSIRERSQTQRRLPDLLFLLPQVSPPPVRPAAKPAGLVQRCKQLECKPTGLQHTETILGIQR